MRREEGAREREWQKLQTAISEGTREMSAISESFEQRWEKLSVALKRAKRREWESSGRKALLVEKRGAVLRCLEEKRAETEEAAKKKSAAYRVLQGSGKRVYLIP